MNWETWCKLKAGDKIVTSIGIFEVAHADSYEKEGHYVGDEAHGYYVHGDTVMVTVTNGRGQTLTWDDDLLRRSTLLEGSTFGEAEKHGYNLDTGNPIMFAKLLDHLGHSIECVRYGGLEIADTANAALECRTCGMVLVSYNKSGE